MINMLSFWPICAAMEFVAIVILSIFCVRLYNNKKKYKQNGVKKDTCCEQLLYQHFGEKWNDIFTRVNYPITEEEKREILELIWSVSSTTIDYLMVANSDPNCLKRNKDVYDYLTGSTNEIRHLKTYYHDPTTVPCQVMAVYDILKEIGYKGSIIAFGYRINIE